MRRTHRFATLLVCLCSLLRAASANAEQQVWKGDYYNLGGFSYPVSTESTAAQVWFDRGLAMCFGFNHEEAVRCFEKALAEDPGLAMAHWGIAYALGPNLNNMLIPEHQIVQAEYAARMAKLHTADATPLERALVEAVATRYAAPAPPVDERRPLNEAYVAAMKEVYAEHGDSPLAAALYAESLMNLQPWKHWTPEGEPGPQTEEVLRVLESGLEKSPGYPALCHLHIHAVEASPSPDQGLPSADALVDLMPGQGHLLHMPTHIYIWVGDYAKVVSENAKAIKADDEFMRREGPYNFYTLYRIHNYHFLTYGAMFDGQSELALKAARELVDQVPEDMLRQQTDFLDAFMPTALHVLVRFGRWEQILEEPEPADYLPMSRAIWRYARTLAYAATDRVEEAEEEQELFLEARDAVPGTSFLFQNASLNILEVAEAMLAGEVAYRRGEHEAAFAHLRKAVELDDALNYDEPWGWMQPARHALGALLMEQERYAEAEPVYRRDLELHPNNPWALHGLAECLEALGKDDESATCRAQFTAASTRADVRIDRSCYCRLEGGE